ncbi:hypothetical protein [Gillisia limnaea]|uniref:hypothetical protein n=1 Tax=Gillisia limnaea TaxID=195907 RepID=UPI0039EEB1FD
MKTTHILSWLFGIAVFATGILNMILVHFVPGVIYLFIALIYFPPLNAIFRERFGFEIPPLVKAILGIMLIMFTLGVSDLGEMIDKL